MIKKKITIIYPFSYGYIDFVTRELESHEDIDITEIKTDTIKYVYPSFWKKIENGITKIFGRNSKKIYFKKQILKRIFEKQDIIFIIRPDLLEDSLLVELKGKTDSFVAYFYDSCTKYPRQAKVCHFFDKVYSYEKEDIEKYDFLEASNFIYDQTVYDEEIKYDMFNVSSYDSRIDVINNLSKILFDAGFKIHFILFWFKQLSYPHLTSITEYLSLQETKKKILQSRALIDIQRMDQNGLSFRTFESLGFKKKLITTNKMVKYYDFYHPNNILIIDSENVATEEIYLFLELPYVNISKDILNKYTLQTFVKNIFNL